MKHLSSQRIADVLDGLMFGGLLGFLLLLPFHLVIKKLVPDPLGTYWKEILLGLLILLWAIRSLLVRRLVLIGTSLDSAVLIYAGLLLLRFVLDGTRWAGAWGLYASIMYLPLFWLIPAVLSHRPARSTILIGSLVAVGAVVALGGLIEFFVNVPLWPSAEIAQRQGMPGMFLYGTNIRRVYFTFDSPTTLANTLGMLLPLALILILISKRLMARLASAIAAALIAACIVVTFSRGIWVATAVSLAVMGAWFFLSSRSRRIIDRQRLRSLLVVGGTLALIAVVWAVALMAWSPWENSTYQGVVELPAEGYRTAPVTTVGEALLSVDPVSGQRDSQTWSLLDPITTQEDTRPVLFEHPPETGKSEIIYAVQVPENGALRFGIALSPEVWSPNMGDGVSFQIYAVDPNAPQDGRTAFVRHINPKSNISDRRWRNFLVDLSPWAGRTVNLSLITDAGPNGDWSFDWAGWSELQLVSITPGYFAAHKTENAIVGYTTSILNWGGDETNRDRLAAWTQGLNAWRSSPWWGTGLGSTGMAALRTQPQQAFVTESQVLKALVELGPLGLLVLAFLWFQIARVGYRTWRRTSDPTVRLVLIGIMTSLLIVFIEGLVYQNLEVKQVNAYFWTLAGMVAFLASTQSHQDSKASRRKE
jgi:hypothetical protein